MAVINFARREIISRIVFYGPQGAGTTAAVRQLYLEAPGAPSGGLLPLFDQESCSDALIFELSPTRDAVPGFELRLRLYALPGSLQSRAHRAEILNEVDALAFVADGRPGRSEANLEALLDLDRALKDAELDLSNMPVAFLVNHSDSAEAMTADEVAYDLNPYGHPVFATDSESGAGLLEALDRLRADLATRLKANLEGQPTSLHVHAIHRRDAASIEQVVESHRRAVQLAASEATATPPDPQAAPPWSRSHFDVLPVGLSVDVPYQPARLSGTRPVHVLSARIEGELICLDVVLDDLEGASPTRLRVNLVPPRDATTPTLPDHDIVEHARPDVELTSPIVTQTTVEVQVPDTARTLGYALLGSTAGLVAGLLVGFLMWG